MVQRIGREDVQRLVAAGAPVVEVLPPPEYRDLHLLGAVNVPLKQLADQGWHREDTFEIPHGPICSFTAPGGHRLAIYELTRPDAAQHFEGRKDF